MGKNNQCIEAMASSDARTELNRAVTPFFSVCIQSYNHEPFIREAIESVLHQTYPHYELIIADDGSTDASPQIITEYAEKYPSKITALLQKENQGIVAAFNRMVSNVRGDLYLGISSDDFLPLDALEKKASFFRQNPEIDLMLSDFDVVDRDGVRHSGIEKYAIVPQFRRFHNIEPEQIYAQLLQRNFIPEIVVTVNLARVGTDEIVYDRQCPHVSDFDLLLNLSRKYRWGKCADITAVYRWHGKNLSTPGLAQPDDSKFNQEMYVLAKQLVMDNSQDRREMIVAAMVNMALFCFGNE